MLNKLTQSLQHLMGTTTPEWLAPISEAEPCGLNLEYDPEYLLLMAKATPKNDAQYGDFVDTPEGPNWADIERDCRRLLLRSRDITLLVLLLRCHTRIGKAAGLREGLARLVTSLEHDAEHIHPQLLTDGERDVAMRANALAALADPDGLLSDIRDLTLSKSSAMRLEVRDVERAFSLPCHPDAQSVAVIQRQLTDLRQAGDDSLKDLTEASVLVGRLQRWVQGDLLEDAPNLQPLVRLLRLFASESGVGKLTSATSANPTESPLPDTEAQETVCEPKPTEIKHSVAFQSSMRKHLDDISDQMKTSMNPSELPTHTINGRQTALQAMREAREWFELVEPSSPVSILLRQAEKMVGKRFSEVAQSIPPDLLARWEQE